MRVFAWRVFVSGEESEVVGDKIARLVLCKYGIGRSVSVYLTVSPCLCGFGGGCWLAVVMVVVEEGERVKRSRELPSALLGQVTSAFRSTYGYLHHPAEPGWLACTDVVLRHGSSSPEGTDPSVSWSFAGQSQCGMAVLCVVC